MKRTLTLLTAAAMLLAGASIGWAEDAKTETKADAPTQAQLRAQMHRATATLIEARAAEKPDEANIEKLADKVQALRSQMWAQRDARGVQTGQRRQWDGPRRGGQRMGRGYGPGKGAYAQGQGRGMGRGQGRGMGYGMGRGMGGQGRGMGYGMGRGMGGQGRGMEYGMGRGQGRGMGYGMGRGLGRQWGYVDKNQDGICDNAQPPAPAKSVQPEK